MVQKKPDGKQKPRTRLSQAARLLGGAVRANAPVPAHQEEPWRNRKRKGKVSR
jgi:hypothetical protein